MSANSRFAVATHILASLTQAGPGETLTSAYLASSVNTHAVVVRRIVADLVKAGLVQALPGKHGGFRLDRPADQISLWDVMRAVDGCTVFGFNPNPVNPNCPVSVRMGKALKPVLAQVQDSVEQNLRKLLVADILSHPG